MLKKRPLCVVRIVDDDAGVRDSYRFLIESDGWLVKTYRDAEDFMDNDDNSIPGCGVFDVRMPGLSGLELQEYMNRIANHLPVILISAHANVEMVVRAMRNGALDFLPKPVEEEKLLAAIEKAVELSFSTKEADEALDDMRRRWETLSQREKETAQWVARGQLNKLIADAMAISERTVQVHRANAYQKLGVKNAVELSKVLDMIGVPAK